MVWCCTIRGGWPFLWRDSCSVRTIYDHDFQSTDFSRYCAGFLSQSSAIKVAYYRGVLASKLAKTTTKMNSMVAVGLSESRVSAQLKELEQARVQGFDASLLTLSCINSPTSATISGPCHQLDILIAHLRRQDIFAQKLNVSVAYHSPQMHDIASEYLDLLQELEEGSKGREVLMMSSVTCEIVSADKVCTGEYWVENMVSPVHFLEAMRLCCFRSSMTKIIKKLDRSHRNEIVSDFWIEVGPHSALRSPIRDILKSVQRSDEVGYSPALVRNRSAVETILEAAGHLFCWNFSVDAAKINMLGSASTHPPKVVTDLPPYPFNHSVVYCEESQTNKAFRFRQHATHTLLGTQTADWSSLEPKWKLIIRAEEMPWIADHKVNGSILYPAAGMITMAVEASKLLAQGRSPIGFEIRNAEFPAPLLIPPMSEGIETFITLNPIGGSGNEHRFQIVVRKSERDWEMVCKGLIRLDFGRDISDVDGGKEAAIAFARLKDLHDRAKTSCPRELKAEAMYKQFREEVGFDYGPSFQPLDQIQFNDSGEAIAAIIPFTWSDKANVESEKTLGNIIHPATLDGFFQLAFVGLTKGGSAPLRTMVPTRVGRIWVSSLGAGNSIVDQQRAHARTEMICQRLAQCSISVINSPNEQPRVQIEELELTAVSDSSSDTWAAQVPKHLCYHMDWKVDFDTLNVDQIHTYCERARKSEPDPIEWFKDIETLALSFGAQALKDLRMLNREPVQTLSKYVSWLQSQLDRDLAATPIEQAQARKELLYDRGRLSALCDRMAVSNKRGELYAKVGRDLTQMLLGEIDPLQLLFTDDQLLADFYEEMSTSSTAFDAVARYLDAIVHKNPGMKFLEIGGGTGAITKFILKALATSDDVARYGQYAFTDISHSFLTKAQARFEAQKRLSYGILNIEEDPTAQGFVEGEYDVLIATMVLHATNNLDITIRNARRLLKPGGILIFMEMTVPDITRTAFAFGLLPGWWLSSEDYRQQSSCITEVQWHEVLCRNGFSGTDVVFRDFKADECHGWSVMVSTAVTEMEVVPRAQKATLLLNAEGPTHFGSAEKLSYVFEASGCSTITLTLAEAASLKDISDRHFVLLDDLDSTRLRKILPDTFSALQTLLASAGSFLWVTNGGGTSSASPDYGMVAGLCRVSRNENQAVPLVTLALDATKATPLIQSAVNIVKVFNQTASRLKNGEFESEYSEIDGLLHINRMTPINSLNEHVFEQTAQPVRIREFGAAPSLKLSIRTLGLLDSLEFVNDPSVDEPLKPEEVLIEVQAIGVNFKDCLTLLGRVNSDELGSDCSGIIARVGEGCKEFQVGDRVLACTLNTYRTFARANTYQVVKIPHGMTFVEAASIPTAFSTAYYSLCEVARLQKGETILIHAASGGTGQAAVQVASSVGAEIFATVGSLVKKQLLMELYNVPEDHIFYSRDLSFADGIRRMTNGRGVDVVLNSLSGDGLVASWECIAPFGKFVEIGRKDIDSRGSLPMYPFIRNASFSGVDLAGIAGKGALGRRILDETMSMFHTGKASLPSPIHVYSLTEIKQAFRFLQSGTSSGKIVVDVKKTSLVPVSDVRQSPYFRDINKCPSRLCCSQNPAVVSRAMQLMSSQEGSVELGAVFPAGSCIEVQSIWCFFPAVDRTGTKWLRI
jgi:NADPH:quinone reductase-like Zn-dependent oxidoreductase/ubiquinone/menaquinone biosynthesis C-methylase UbiE